MPPKINEYDKQALDFCEKFGFTVVATEYTKKAQRPPRWVARKRAENGFKPSVTDGAYGLRYRIHIIRRIGGQKLKFDYWGSVQDREVIKKSRSHQGYSLNPVDQYGILRHLALDSCVHKRWNTYHKIIDFFDQAGEIEALRDVL